MLKKTLNCTSLIPITCCIFLSEASCWWTPYESFLLVNPYESFLLVNPLRKLPAGEPLTKASCWWTPYESFLLVNPLQKLPAGERFYESFLLVNPLRSLYWAKQGIEKVPLQTKLLARMFSKNPTVLRQSPKRASANEEPRKEWYELSTHPVGWIHPSSKGCASHRLPA